MTIKTLSYIHSLLKAEEDKYYNFKVTFYESMREAEGNGEDATWYKAAYEDAKAKWSAAYEAREDFESRDW